MSPQDSTKRRDIDDRSAASLHHFRNHPATHQQRAKQVYPNRSPKLVQFQVGNRSVPSRPAARTVEENVYSTKSCKSGLNDGIDLDLVADVTSSHDSRSSKSRNLGCGSFGRFRATVGNNDVRTLVREGNRTRSADSVSTSSDQGRLSFKSRHGDSRPGPIKSHAPNRLVCGQNLDCRDIDMLRRVDCKQDRGGNVFRRQLPNSACLNGVQPTPVSPG